MYSAPHATSRIYLISLLLGYALIISLCAPFAIKRAQASTEMDKGGKESAPAIGSANSELYLNSSTQGFGQRPGELLVRFREGVTEHDKAAAVAAQGGRRKALRGESGIEKLEVAAGQDMETVALQLRLNPAVEFAEPNFLIKRDDLRADAGARNIARPFTGPNHGNRPGALDSLNPIGPAHLAALSTNLETPYSNSLAFNSPLQSQGSQPDDPRFNEQWALHNTGQNGGQFGSDIGVTSAWRITTGSQATVIAVIDSGVDFTHPELSNNNWVNSAPGANGDVNGWDYITDSGVIRDEQGHGTAIAGIIAAQGNNASGISGVMWRASLMSLRVLDSTGTGDVANAVEAIDYSVAHGAQVINISWGTTGDSTALRNAIERAIRRGVVVVCSSGNNGQDLDSTPYYPAAFNIRNLITVASTDNFDQLASWSNWGPRRVSVAAPGVSILTTQMGGGYQTVTGTSASSPLMAGVAGLMKSYRPLADAADIRSALVDGSRPVASLAGKVSAGGVVDAAAAFAVLQPNPYTGSGSGGNNGNPPATGEDNVPPGQRQDDSGRRANGRQGLLVPEPTPSKGAPAANLPDLDESRRVRTSPTTNAPSSSIQSNLVCADCDPGGGGGAGGSDPYFGTGRTRPQNETGDPGVTLGSRNFNWSMPLVNLKGRAGLDLSIALYYNSLVWTRQGNSIQYNADHGTPAPGFQIGLPRLQAQYFDTDDGAYSHIMVTPSGGRVQMKQVSAGVFESSDGTYTQLTFVNSVPVVKTTDGTQYWFGAAFTGEWRCTKIQDRNGNYISATYLATTGHINTITDTLGRTLQFRYYAAPDNNLWKIEQTRGGATHKWVEFYYGSVTMSFSFPGLSVYGASQGSSKTVLSYVQFSDHTSYHFDYNSYGQVYQIRHKAPDGHELEHTLYTTNTVGAQTDCPRFTDRRDYAQDWNNNQEAITSYSVTNNATWNNPETGAQQTGTLVQQTSPDGTIYKEYSHASGWASRLTRLSEVWSGGVKKKWISTAWVQDNMSLTYPHNPRVIEVNIYDESGNRRRTTIDYTSYNLPSAVREWTGAGANVLYRLTATGYRFDTEYINRRVIGLVDNVQVTNGNGAVVSKNTYGYDWDWSGDMFQDTPVPATQHNRTDYGPGLIYGRGNLSEVARWDANDPANGRKAVETKWRVNSTGSVLMERDHRWHQKFFEYADSFSAGGNRNTFAYPTKVIDAEGNYSTIQYDYDFGAVTRTHSPTSGTGVGTTYLDEVLQYDSHGRLERITNQTTNAYTSFIYETNANYVHTYQTVIDLTQANEFHSWQVLDGAGRVRNVASIHPGSTGGYSGQYFVYNNMGRVTGKSNPTEITAAWIPSGADAAGWRRTDQTYDWQGRPRQTANSDGSTRILSYGGCGCAGGEVTTVQDEHGRQRRLTKDRFGRLATVEELNWNGSVYATTTYTYNERDQITGSNQAGQLRTFVYDGHGRLQSRTTPEQGQTTYTYNQDDTINFVTDARGAKTTFTYNARHLPTNISYDLSSVIPGQNVAATPNVSFGYDAAGNRTSMTDGLGSTSYAFNNLAQLTSETRTFTGVGTYTLTYGYNLSGALKSISNPWGAQVGYGYDKAGRVNNVTGSGYAGVSNYASTFSYRAFGGVKGMAFGNGRALTTAYDSRLRPTTWNVSNVLGYNYNYDYFNERTGRVSYAQNIASGGGPTGGAADPTLDRSYEYDQVGRLANSHSGAEARAAAYSGQWGTMDGPFSLGFDYDVWGNLTHRYGWGGEVQGGGAGQARDIYYSYANNKRNGFTYDLSGNLINDLAQTFTYDATGQQTTANYGGYSLQQSYDGNVLRVKKNDNGAQTYYLRSSVLGGQVVAEIIWASGSWRWGRGYVYLGSQLLAVQQAGVFWMHEDPVTKSKRVTNSAGTVVSTIELDPWGADTNRSNNAAFQPRKFTSYTRDGNGSDEAMFRRYNRWHSRFDQPDPYDGSYSLADPQSFNRYAYVKNDPVNFVDPSGLLLEDPAGRSRAEPLSGLGFMGPGVHSFETTGYIQIGYFAETLLPAYLPVLVTAYYGVGGPSGGGGGGGDGQQNRVPLTQDQLDAIRNQIAAFLNDKCANFINQIVSGRTGNPYDSKKQLLTDFNSVAGGKGGVFFGGNIEGGDARGTIPAGNAQIRIDTMRHFTDPNRAFGAAFVALHELIHIIAGNDIQLSGQVNKLGITVMAYPGKTVAYPTDKDNKNLQYSGYWGQALKNACDPKGY